MKRVGRRRTAERRIVVELSASLVRDAQNIAAAFGQSVSSQIELWVAFGRILEPYLKSDHALRLSVDKPKRRQRQRSSK